MDEGGDNRGNGADNTGSGGLREAVYVDDSYVCQFCGTKLKSYVELRSHMKIHTDQKVRINFVLYEFSILLKKIDMQELNYSGNLNELRVVFVTNLNNCDKNTVLGFCCIESVFLQFCEA